MEERKEEPEGVVACDLGESRNLAFNQQLGDLRIVTASRATLRTVSRSSTGHSQDRVALYKAFIATDSRGMGSTPCDRRHGYLLSQREYL
jgi:hypothetical protein